jgi:hypothetical protein
MLNEAERAELLIIRAKASSKAIDEDICLSRQRVPASRERETDAEGDKVGFEQLPYANAFLLNEFTTHTRAFGLRISRRGLGLQAPPAIYRLHLLLLPGSAFYSFISPKIKSNNVSGYWRRNQHPYKVVRLGVCTSLGVRL